MQCFTKFISPTRHPFRRTETLALTSSLSKSRSYSTMQEDNKLSEFLDYMEKLKNYERVGVPRGAGTESDDGFDLGRMRRLLQRLGNPQTHFQGIHRLFMLLGPKEKDQLRHFFPIFYDKVAILLVVIQGFKPRTVGSIGSNQLRPNQWSTPR